MQFIFFAVSFKPVTVQVFRVTKLVTSRPARKKEDGSAVLQYASRTLSMLGFGCENSKTDFRVEHEAAHAVLVDVGDLRKCIPLDSSYITGAR